MQKQTMLSPRGFRLYLISFWMMCLVVVWHRVVDAGIAAWIDQLQADYFFSGAYFPQLTSIALLALAVTVAFSLGLFHDVFVTSISKHRQGQPAASIAKDGWKVMSGQRRLSWEEPVNFTRAVRNTRPINYQKRIFLALSISALASALLGFFLSYIIGTSGFSEWFWIVPAIALSLSAFFIVLIPYCNEIMPASVVINSKGIERRLFEFKFLQMVVHTETWLWDDIDNCTVETLVISGREFQTVRFTQCDKKYVIALGKNIECAQLESVFAANKKTLDFSMT